jgi:hypothetical protein
VGESRYKPQRHYLRLWNGNQLSGTVTVLILTQFLGESNSASVDRWWIHVRGLPQVVNQHMVACSPILGYIAARDYSVNHAFCLLSGAVEDDDPHSANNAAFVAGRKYVVRPLATDEYAADWLV